MKTLVRLTALASALLYLAQPVAALDTTARAALVVDHATGTVLLSKQAEQAMPPASMSKLMTLLVLESDRLLRIALTFKSNISGSKGLTK